MTALQLAENPRAVSGGNHPPPATPYEIAKEKVEDIYSEAEMWLDGAQVDSQDLADGISNLLAEIRKARKLADETRKVEKEPHDKAAAEVQGRYKPLLDKADLAAEACKKALAPWLQKIADEQAAAARKAREEAEAKQRAAQEAIRAADAANLEERAKAEALIKDAKKAETVANRAERQTATAGGAMGRATTLRTVYVAMIADATAFARYVWTDHRAEMDEFLSTLAKRLVDGGKREIPGITITTEKRAV